MLLSNRHSSWESLWQQDPSRFNSGCKHLKLRGVVIGKVAFNCLVDEKWQPGNKIMSWLPNQKKTIDFSIYSFSGFQKVKATKWFAVKFALNLQKLQWYRVGANWRLWDLVRQVWRLNEGEAGLLKERTWVEMEGWILGPFNSVP